MSNILIVSEKPNVAKAIAKALKVKEAIKYDGYIEGYSEFYGVTIWITWCIGHLVEMYNPDQYDPKYSKWNYKDLPIIPSEFKYRVIPGKEKQFQVVAKLMNSVGESDQDKMELLTLSQDRKFFVPVTELIEATDSGREGELIFRLVYHKAGCTKPFRRLWISSMEDSAIRDGFQNLLSGENYDALYEAALCRAKADWLVGINATRLFTTLYRGKTLNVGRVMTPTLALLTDRELAIAGFRKEKFYTVELDCGVLHVAGGRFTSKTEAEKQRKACLGKPVIVQASERQEKTEKSPKLYDLTTLQREANRLYGYTAQQTLDYVQLLYEKKLATYPRTDSRYLTGDMAPGLPALCQSVAGAFAFGAAFSGGVDAAQVTDNSRVSDHHAILPTKEAAAFSLGTLPTGERNILSLLAVRLLCAVCPDKYRYADTAITVSCAGAEFKAKGRTELSEGWKSVEKALKASFKEKTEEKVPVSLPEIPEGTKLTAEAALLREGTTNPPKRYTEDSLLLAMQNAGAEEFAQIEDLERTGLGTPATRAGVIEKLVKGGFVERKNKLLVPTTRGMELTKVLPDTVKSAKLTADWEAALKEVERGERTPEDFLKGITDMVCGLVKSYEGVNIGTDAALSDHGREVIGKCPRCGKPVHEGKKSFYCSGYKDTPPCGFALWKDNLYFKSKRKELTKKVASALLKNGKVKMTGLYSEKKDLVYDATVVMDDTGGKYVNFKLEFDQKK